MLPRCAPEGLPGTGRQDPHDQPAFGQIAGSHESVPAIVTPAGHQRHLRHIAAQKGQAPYCIRYAPAGTRTTLELRFGKAKVTQTEVIKTLEDILKKLKKKLKIQLKRQMLTLLM